MRNALIFKKTLVSYYAKHIKFMKPNITWSIKKKEKEKQKKEKNIQPELKQNVLPRIRQKQ